MRPRKTSRVNMTPDSPRERFRGELTRLTDRIRAIALSRLEQSAPVAGTRAEAVRAVAQSLADLAAELAGDGVRPLPRLADAAAADQLAVTGADLVAALAERPDDAVAADALAALVELRGRC